MLIKKCDFIIIGAGIYGSYAALKLSKKHPNKKIALLECESDIFERATYVNQARLHNGYHYPRSLYTAIKCQNYFEKFYNDYRFAILDDYTKIYAIAHEFSMVSPSDFEKFCFNAKIPCEVIDLNKFFRSQFIDSAYITKEHTIDMLRLKEHFKNQIHSSSNIDLYTNFTVDIVNQHSSYWEIKGNDCVLETDWVLNATYGSLNLILEKFGFDPMPMKFELTEMVLCEAPQDLLGYGLTVMDGPFFSLMPFDFQGQYSLSSVRYTPHETTYTDIPQFSCQSQSTECSQNYIANCNTCPVRPESSWIHMRQLAKKYLLDNLIPTYNSSIYTIKALMQSSTLSDSRPVIIEKNSEAPGFISVLGGKINTIYEMDSFL